MTRIRKHKPIEHVSRIEGDMEDGSGHVILDVTKQGGGLKVVFDFVPTDDDDDDGGPVKFFVSAADWHVSFPLILAVDSRTELRSGSRLVSLGGSASSTFSRLR